MSLRIAIAWRVTAKSLFAASRGEKGKGVKQRRFVVVGPGSVYSFHYVRVRTPASVETSRGIVFKECCCCVDVGALSIGSDGLGFGFLDELRPLDQLFGVGPVPELPTHCLAPSRPWRMRDRAG
jgi:hypothetical protein